MRRSLLLKGDVSSAGGVVLEGEETPKHYGTPLTYIGARVHCPACKSEGVIAARGPRWPHSNMGKEQALEGDICVCKCQPFPVMVASQFTSYEEFDSYHLQKMEFDEQGKPLATTSSKLADVADSNAVTDEGLICPNMTNDQFFATMLRLRDKAVRLVDDRLAGLKRWNPQDQALVKRWFGVANDATHEHLPIGLQRVRSILSSLTAANFYRFSLEAVHKTGCVPRSDGIGTVAAVCGPDGLHGIFFYPGFCLLPDEQTDFKGTPLHGDSKLLTLIHEVTHFTDAMGSRDVWYSTKLSMLRAADVNQFCIENADNIASYVVGVTD